MGTPVCTTLRCATIDGRAYEELLSWGLREDDANNANETPFSVKRVGSLSFADDTYVVKFTPGMY